jgi:3-hydroxymyristoyl/3-hydroxydecanoyl-(acyl carrier protein) dehydratase
MPEHFAAFSFVDRITEFEAGTRARGEFAVPREIASFPSCLVAEAVGQLAAWVAMEKVSFRGRPVAALANETRFHGEVRPGDMLAIGVEIASCDDEAVAYAGWARVGGSLVIELQDCLGPMLPVEDFDSPASLAERFELLRGPGAAPGRFHGVVGPRIVPGDSVSGESVSATLHVPASAPFFGDHFPRRPVFPATLLLDAQIAMAMQLAALGARPERMTHVKMRSFIAPGDVLQIEARRAPADARRILLSARADNGKTVATARLETTSGEGE